MIPGIDPKIDIAFKRVFGSQEWQHLTIALIEAVLQPAAGRHVAELELPNFQRDLNDLRNPLDFWLYFLKNGVALDADQLPIPLDTLELRQAMEVLKMFSQDEMARELYEGRLKAERDAKMWETDRNRTLAEIAEATQQLDTTTQQLNTTTQQLTEAEQQLTEAEQQFQQELAHRIQLCERLLGRSVSETTELLQRDALELQELASRLERELTQT